MVNTWYFYLENNSHLPPCSETVDGTHVSLKVNNSELRNWGCWAPDTSTNDQVKAAAIEIAKTYGWDTSPARIYLVDGDVVYWNDVLVSGATHIIKYKLSDNAFFADIQSGMAAITTHLITELVSDYPITFIKAEVDASSKTFNVFVKYTGVAPSGYDASSLITVDEVTAIISAWATWAMVFILTVIVAVLIAAIILSGGWTAIAIAQALLAGSAIMILGYVVYGIVADNILKTEVIKNQTAFIEVGLKAAKAIDQFNAVYEASPKTRADCLTLLEGYKSTGLSYANELKIRLPLMDIAAVKTTFTSCSDGFISSFNAETTDCAASRAGILGCINSLSTGAGTNFTAVYDPEGNYVEASKKGSDWGTVALLGIGILGIAYVLTQKRR